MKRTPLRPGTKPLARHSGLPRARKPLRARNPERQERLLERQFGPPERRAWIASLPCATCPAVRGRPSPPPSENSHVRSRGAGGGPDDVVPQCAACHRELHRGRKSFEARHGLDLAALAAAYARRWRAELS